MDKVFKIFVDFDGTISSQDVGESVFLEFGELKKVNKIIDALLSDEISAKQCWVDLCNSIEKIEKEKLDSFIDSLKIEESFHRLVNFCDENKFSLYVLSDGFDYYIKRIFEREKLNHLKYFANKLIVTEDNRLKPSFPYEHENCRTSANCKRNHIINLSADEDYTVYVGDGNSDRFAAQFCDFIFAKDGLLKFCEMERISFFPFKDFDDVVERLESLKLKKRLKKRHQAELKRKNAYMEE